uniref:Uncharacterized protein n=1 Tax=Glossina brevipalpis TaxID=37001 RepID=A0A1A9W860_9MUSC
MLRFENLCCLFPRNGYNVSSFTGHRYDTSPIPSSRRGAAAVITARSGFCTQPLHHRQQLQSQQLQHPTEHVNTFPPVNPSYLKNFKKSTDFEQIHEKFRQVVMKDILAYRAHQDLKSRPLIEL